MRGLYARLLTEAIEGEFCADGREAKILYWMGTVAGVCSSLFVCFLFLRDPLLGGPTAVDDDVGAGEKTGIRRADIEQAFRDFLDFAPPSDRKAGDELLVQFRIVEDRNIHLGGARAGADAVDGDAFGSEFESERFSEAEEAGFAGGIGGAAREGDVAHDRGEVDDAAVTFAPHVGNERAAHQERTDEIGVQDGGPLLIAEVCDVFADVDAGIVDQDVNLAELRDDEALQFADVLFARDIGGEYFGRDVVLASGFGDGIERIGIASDEGEIRTGLGEGEGESFTEAFASAGDDRGTVFERVGHNDWAPRR